MSKQIEEVMGLVDTHARTRYMNAEEADSALATIEAKLRELLPVWQPISSAPRDGTRILLLTDVGAIEAFWDFEWLSDAGMYWKEVTHWMPLPKEPE